MFASRTHFDPVKKIWSGDDLNMIYNQEVSLGYILLYMLNRDCNKIVQVSADNGVEFTGKQLSDFSVRVALNLQTKGLQQEDVIGVMAANSPYLAPVVFGAFLNGSPISTLDVTFDKGEIKHMFGTTRPKLVFCDAKVYPQMKEAIEELSLECPIYIISGQVIGVGSVEEFLVKTGKEDTFLPPKLKKGGNQTAAILCSSGTTGLPKGVCISHAMMLSQVLAFNSDYCHAVLLCFSTLYWLSGLLTLVMGTITGSKRIIIDESFSPELLLKLIEQYKVSLLQTPPSQMAMVINCPDIKTRDLSSLRSYLCGGSIVPPQIAAEMETYLPNGDVKVGYGMTEIASLCSGEHIMKRRGSVGQITFNTQIKIIDDNGKKLGIGENGEICIKTLVKCSGYYGNPEATKNLFDEDGWILTGDIGHFDDEGFLFIIDRKKEILKYKNYHFFPAEIESVIREIPEVMDVCVCGIPDIIATDLPAAAIIKKTNSNLTVKDVYDFVAKRMAHFKHLHGGVYFLDSLPMTPSGKVQRRKVRDILEKLHNQN